LDAILKQYNEQIQQILERQFQQTVVIHLEVNPDGSPCLHQAAGGSAAPEHEQAEAESFPGREIRSNQQDPPTEIDMWKVILSFKNSFNLFLQYLTCKLNVVVQHLDVGSLLITVECRSLQILEGLWEDYSSGHLNQVARETLITAEVLEKLELTEVTLKTSISVEQYEKGKQIFMDSSDHGGHSKLRMEDTTKELKL